nr:MAG TPA: hypothetical protein [Caudoviricetes sp.]
MPITSLLKPAQHNRNKKSEINYSSRFFSYSEIILQFLRI